MKFQAAAFFVFSLLTPSVFATEVVIANLMEGRIAVCASSRDEGRTAYILSNPFATLKNNEVTLNLEFSQLICGHNQAGVQAWVNNPHPLDPVSARDLNGLPILIQQQNLELLLTRSNDSLILGSVPAADVAKTSLTFSLPLETLMTISERSAFDSGSSVVVRTTFFQRGLVSVRNYDGEDMVMGLRSGGAYSVLLTLVKNNSGTDQAVGVRLK